MYFASRLQAGRMLAEQLTPKYRYENCVVMAMSDGGALIGAQIAMQLHCVLTLLMSSEITLPREPNPIAGITTGGTVSYNHGYSKSELDEMIGEYYNYIEQEKLVRMHDMNQLVSHVGTLKKDMIRGHNVIVVTDGLKSPFLVDIAAEFLKPISIEKLIVAVPLASVATVDRLHVLADDLYVLSVVEDYIDTDHYYDKQDVPDHETVLRTVEDIVLKWK
jgi:putative phosphoribosyl transferase